jgi:hypothetical protein
MYRRSKFMEILLEIREEMSRQSDYDVDLFAEIVRSGKSRSGIKIHDLNGTDKLKPVLKKGKKTSAG